LVRYFEKIDLSSEGSMQEVGLNNAKPMVQVKFGGSLIVYDHDWQYPAITEKHAYHRMLEVMHEQKNIVYVAFPWATLIDLLNNKKPNCWMFLMVLKS
jgi:hypothetical protein